MYAVVEIAGQQFKVGKDQKLFVHRLDNKEGSLVAFDRVYLVDDGKNISFGTPSISGTVVNAKVLKHLKGEKVIVFKVFMFFFKVVSLNKFISFKHTLGLHLGTSAAPLAGFQGVLRSFFHTILLK